MSDSTATLLRFELFDYWLAGTGEGRGHDVDLTCQREPSGLPFLPGRTVKGLLRDAVRRAESLGQLADLPGEGDLFGSGPDECDRYETQQGRLRIDDARPLAGLETQLMKLSTDKRSSLTDTLFRVLSSTAMEDGMAKRHSLRRVEVALPLCLTAPIRPLDGAPESWLASIETAVPLIRALGSGRNRGLGRVRVTVEQAHG